MKTCNVCDIEQPLAEFWAHPENRGGKCHYCRTCGGAKNRANRLKNREVALERDRQYRRRKYAEDPNFQRRYDLKRYGLSLEQYDAMYEDQGGCCAICGVAETEAPKGRLHVDHDHATGVVRKLLCHGCNTGLGGLRHDPELLILAAKYLVDTATTRGMG